MPENVANYTIFEGDNLDIVRGFNSASVDLIYLATMCPSTWHFNSAESV